MVDRLELHMALVDKFLDSAEGVACIKRKITEP